MYDIGDKFIYEVLEDYKDAKSDSERDEIFTAFTNKIWSIKNPRDFSTKYIKYTVFKDMVGDVADVFKKYCKTPYKSYRSVTTNQDPWYLLRQRINNIYTYMCDTRLCVAKDYLDLLHTAQILFYQYMDKKLTMESDELDKIISGALCRANQLFEKYSREKLPLTWREYRMLVDDWLCRICDNYIPFEQNSKAVDLSVYSDFWNEDNYAISYIGKSINGYMKNYQKQFYGLPLNKKYKRCECGRLFVKRGYNHQFCDVCKKQKTLNSYRKYNDKRHTNVSKE